MSSKSHRVRAASAVSLLALLAAAPAAIAAPAEPHIAFAIPAGSLESVLTAYATRAGVQLLYTPDLVRGRRSAGLMGDYTARAALDRLLAGTGILVEETRPGVLVLRTGVVSTPLTDVLSEVAATSSVLDEVVVTGTHIRGVAAGASPLASVDRDAIDRQGYATVADTLAALPQNFGGLATPDVMTSGIDLVSQNAGRATTVNLRGLGPDATLVLINGRRMAGAGGRGDLADVSAIPTAAVDRVDILLDGASALYGADAVGGVVNIRLKRDFDGAETRLRYGGARGLSEVQAAQTFGRRWEGGHALLSYEYYRRGALAFADRAFSQSADLRRFDGGDYRSINASPGNILARDPATGALAPAWAIPAGATAFPLQPSDFRAGEVNLDSPRAVADLLPQQTRHSVYGVFGLDLTPDIALDADLRFSHRTTRSASFAPTATLTVSDNNPFFASPDGARSHQIAYSFQDELDPPPATSAADSFGASLGLDAALFGDWRLDAYVAYASERTKAGSDRILQATHLREAAGTTPDDPATAFRTSVEGFFNPYGDGQANSRAILDFIASGYARQKFKTDMASFNAQADGTLFALPGGALKLAVGVHGRREAFGQITETFGARSRPAFLLPPTYRRKVVAAFAELRAPLVGPANARPFLRSLDLSLAGRIERYDDVGTTANPKVGLVWAPADGVTVRGTWGTSFRAPVLAEIYQTPSITASFYTDAGTRLLALNRVGGNRDLAPETATSWTFGVDLRPAAVPGLSVSATLFDTDFQDQVDRPVSRFINANVRHPAIAPFVRFVSPTNPADQAAVAALLADPAYATPGLHPAEAFALIVDNRFVNTGRLHVRGLDLSGGYDFDIGEHRFGLAASLSYLFDYELQLTPAAAVTDFVDLAGQPADLRGRASLNWSRGDLGGTLTAHYVDDYRDDRGRTIEAWTTLDAQLRWTPRQPRLAGLTLTATVQNLFDRDPPFYDFAAGVGYDAANAEPLGRFASIQIAKRW